MIAKLSLTWPEHQFFEEIFPEGTLRKGMTALQAAASEGHYNVVKQLLHAGALDLP